MVVQRRIGKVVTGQRDDPGKVCVKMLLLIELSPKQELTC